MADKSLNKQVSNTKDIRYNHKWGFTDTKFVAQPDRTVVVTGDRYALSGTVMPELIPFIEEILHLPFELDNHKPEVIDKPVTPANINKAFYAALQAALPADRYSQDDTERLIRSHGQTTADELFKVYYDRLDRVTDLVCYPETEEEAATIVRLAIEHNICLVPYGGGTSVSCALQLPKNETRMIVVIDTRRMNKIEWINAENLTASILAGITGKQLEEELNAQGYTCGHEPDSMELSTLGGWIATNASGMKKNRYGNIEQIVENVTMITPQGVITQHEAMPRLSVGMQPQLLLFGSEGNLGLITKATIKIHKLPDINKYGSIVFPTFNDGKHFLYDLMRAGVLPASVRLVDNIQFRLGSALKPAPTTSEKIMGAIQKFFLLKVKGFDPNELAAATIVMEGTAEEVSYQQKVINKLMKRHGGIAGGEGNGKRGYMLTYAIAYIRDFLADFYIIGETYETTVPWDKIDSVITAVKNKALELHDQHQLPGRPFVSPRITQLYHSGVCIYFTHAFSTKGIAEPEKILADIDKQLRYTIMEAGGSISHHHGVGKLRKEFVPRTLSETSIELLRDLKQSSDPDNIFGIRNNVFAD